MDVEKEIVELNRDLNRLTSLVKEIREQLTRTVKRVGEQEAFTLRTTRKLRDYCHFLHDRLHAVFHKVFPDDLKYGDEFRRILGEDVGPEEPRKRP